MQCIEFGVTVSSCKVVTLCRGFGILGPLTPLLMRLVRKSLAEHPV
jgi:hypothetical protein